MAEKPKLSLVIPVYNEEGSLPELYSRLTSVLKPLGLPYEIIMIDDGSGDRSAALIAELNARDPRVKLLGFSRNFGHMLALTAGLDAAAGDAVITLDADLQHPPELIPELLRRWQAGAEIVNTLRRETADSGPLKKYSAGLFYRLFNRITGVKLPVNAADYRLLDRKVVDTLKNVRERARFLRGLISWVGFRQEFVDYQAGRRFAGKTKYSLGKMAAFAVDGITSFSASPLRLATYLGLFTALFSFTYLVYAIYIRLFTSFTIEGWTSVLVTVLFIGGVQLIFLGVIGEYLGRIFEETKQRPLYIVSRRLGF
jgi:dolichol-phosphate mannosyltransferase